MLIHRAISVHNQLVQATRFKSTKALSLSQVPVAFCINCGGHNPEDAVFCLSCGQTLYRPPQKIAKAGLLVQHDAQERSVDLKSAVILDEAQFPEFVHEKIDP